MVSGPIFFEGRLALTVQFNEGSGSVTLKSTPNELEGKAVEYTKSGPNTVDAPVVVEGLTVDGSGDASNADGAETEETNRPLTTEELAQAEADATKKEEHSKAAASAARKMAAALEPLRESESATRSTLPKVPVKPKRKPSYKMSRATVTEASAAQVTQAKKQQSTIDLTTNTVSNERGVLRTTQSAGKTSGDIEIVSAVITRTNTIDTEGAIETGGRGTENSSAQSTISESSPSSTRAETIKPKKTLVQTTTEPRESSKPVEQKNEPLPKVSLKRKAAAEPVSSQPAELSFSSTIAEDNSPHHFQERS
ncbi:hypothetical protein LTR95_005746 [Oleoguttula sp. CCFEE 5521]